MERFEPFFQPILDITRCRITGYEALARERLEDASYRSCGPYFGDPDINKDFLLDLDRTVRQKALEQVKNLPQDTFLTLNISPEWMDRLTPSKDVPTIEMVKSLDIDPRRIIIEITETKGNPDILRELVDRYREMGMRIAIDDFGAGYSELARLVALEPDLIKLDMRFFKSAVAGGMAHEAVQAIGFMAERAGCEILCEGVESEQEFSFAVESGATLIQGFLFHPAKQNFVDPEEPEQQVRRLLKQFIQHKTIQERSHIIRHQEIVAYANVMAELLESGHDCPQQLTAPPEGFIRYYLCQPDGDQLSPNFDYYNSQWHEDRSCIGMNWSGRPFLYQVLALNKLVEKRSVTTRPYRDRVSRELFQTLGTKLKDGSILLIDFEP